MKTNYALLSLFCVFFTTVLLGSCSKEEDWIEEVTTDELPGNASYFLTHLLPETTPSKVEKIKTTEPKSAHQYKVTMSDGLVILFDEEGNWQEMTIPGTTIPGSLDKPFTGLQTYLENNNPNDPVTAIYITHYGKRIDLQSGKRLGFEKWGSNFLGYDIIADKIEYLPLNLKNFVQTHFPDESYRTVLQNPTENVESIGYTVWLKNDFKLLFDTYGYWKEIKGFEQELPGSIIASLPEKVKQGIEGSFPNARITNLVLSGRKYTIQVSQNAYYEIDLDSKPIDFPADQAKAFIHQYFGPFNSFLISHSLIEPDSPFLVKVPNGFDFTMDESGNCENINGNGFPFPETLHELIHPETSAYIAANYEAGITKLNTTHSHGYDIITLTDGTGLKFNFKGKFIEEVNIVLSPKEKIEQYLRHQYPEDLEAGIRSYSISGWICRLSDGTEIKFDKDGDLLR